MMKLQEQTMKEAIPNYLSAEVHARNHWINLEISNNIPPSLFDDIVMDTQLSRMIGSIACEQTRLVAAGACHNEIAESLSRKLQHETLWTMFNETLQIADEDNSSSSHASAHSEAEGGDGESGGPPLKTIIIRTPSSSTKETHLSQKWLHRSMNTSSVSTRDTTEHSRTASASSFGSQGRPGKRRLAFRDRRKSATEVLDMASFHECGFFAGDSIRDARWAPICSGERKALGEKSSSHRSLPSAPARSRSPGPQNKKATAIFSNDTGRYSTSSLPTFPDLYDATAMTRWEPIVSSSTHLFHARNK